MSQIKFEETQKFDQLWIKILLVLVIGFTAYIPIEYIIENGFSSALGAPLPLWMGLLISLAVTWFLSSVRLYTNIYDDGIYYRFSPLSSRFTKLAWENIEEISIRKYSGIKEYGGWGIRFSIKGNGKCFTTKGNKGLQIRMKNGKKILIGTQKEAEIQQIINGRSKA